MADRGQVVAKPAGEFDEAQGYDAGAVVDQVQNLFGLKAAIALARHFHLDAELALDPHPRDDVGREFAIGGDDVVAFVPGAKAISSGLALINRAASSRVRLIVASHSW